MRRIRILHSFSVVFLYWFYVSHESAPLVVHQSLHLDLTPSQGVHPIRIRSMQTSMRGKGRECYQTVNESARRSRMRKQKRLQDLVQEVRALQKDNSQISERISVATQCYIEMQSANMF
ncbi:hypothetical protein CXB51_030894 [Gossypium anomalum]|uniref:BZIP domain-containing protein n=1 Tax=Gossypium anomalum TaxID=47600 RepID=A0A8J6CJT4_9ROSI|nr:hypothetical protein CXB51_030894 [Gossypium anomalum]